MIPTYNQAAYIREAIDSALQQTYPNLEIIVGDDASTDSTDEIVGKITDHRLKYIRNSSNIGRAANYRNLLNNHATGDYVVNLDGDDYYTNPDFISEAISLIAADPEVVIVSARACWTILNKEHISDIPGINEASGLFVVKKLPNRKYFFKHMATLYSRVLALKIDFYRADSNNSDWESLYRLSLHGKVKYLDRKVGVWRIHGKNESITTDYNKLLASLEIWPLIYKDAINFGMSQVKAQFACAKCVAYFSGLSCANISLKGNMELVRFIFEVFRKYKLAGVFIVVTPKYAARIVFSFIGYYRIKDTILRLHK